MTTYFFDTSAITKRYLLTETGSRWIRRLLSPFSGNVIVISDITPVEFFSVIARQQRDGSLTIANAHSLRKGFLKHLKQKYLSVPLGSEVLSPARDLVTNYLLRPPDAIQLASAIFATNFLNEPLTSICADRDLLTAAQSEGFAVDNPNAHP